MVSIIISSNRSGNDLAKFALNIDEKLKGKERDDAIVKELLNIIEWREDE